MAVSLLFILSVFCGNIVNAGDLHRIQRVPSAFTHVQNMCVRFVCGLRKYNVSSVQTNQGLLPIADVCTLRTAIVTNKILKSNKPGYLREKLKTRSDLRSPTLL